MKFVRVEDNLSPIDQTVLVRGWGEKKRHYVYELSYYDGRVWKDSARDRALFFVPHEWANLQQPNEVKDDE